MSDSRAKACLYIFSGLPGAGKTTLARKLAAQLPAAYLRIDTIEHVLCDYFPDDHSMTDEGYRLAYRIAADNLVLGTDVVADSCNPLSVTRTAWNSVAISSHSEYVNIEIQCSDPVEHQRRVETRRPMTERFRQPAWDAVVQREYHAWDTPHVVIDTAGETVDQSFLALWEALVAVKSE